MTDILPQLEGTTKAAKCPAGIERERSLKTRMFRVGYLAEREILDLDMSTRS